MARLETLDISQFDSIVIKQLHGRKIFTIIDFVEESTEKLMGITKLPYKDILEIRKQIIDDHVGKITKATEFLEKERKFISTGIQSFDDLLNGGLHSGHIYEICGASSSGKSSICLWLSTIVALNSNSIVHYIDTKNDFSSSRIHMILEENNVSSETHARVMGQIKVTRIKNSCQLLNFLHNLKSTRERIKLIIIDSLSTLFFISKENYEMISSLNHFANICRYLSNEFNLSIVTVNLITQWKETEGLLINDKNDIIIKPMLGKYWRRIPNIRIYIEQVNNNSNNKRILKIWKSLDRKIGESIDITINDKGIF